MPSDTPTGSRVVWHIQKRLNEKGHPVKVDGDLGPKTFWDNSETLKAVLAALGGPIPVAPPKPPAASASGKKVFIDVGHGQKPEGYDPGAVNSKTKLTEHSLNLLGAQAMAARLRELGISATIGDSKLSNYDAGKAARGHDVMVSFHHNAAGGPAQYTLALYDDANRSSDKALATLTAARMAQALGISNKGARLMGLAVLGGAITVGVPSAILVEPYFMHAQTPDNPAPSDMDDWSARAGRAIAEAVADHLGVPIHD